jgi:ferredoxin
VKAVPAACRLRIRPEECVACAACPSVCHTLALRMDALELVLDEDLCDNCSVCVRVCPVGALYIERSNEGSG